MPHSSIVAWIIALALTLGARMAVAQPASANELAAQAGAAFEAGDIAKAASLYEQAYEDDPFPMYLFAAGKLRYQLGECVKAVPHLERFQAAGTHERVGETKAILDACRGQLEAATQRQRDRADLEASIEQAVVARECRTAAALRVRWLELDPAADAKARLSDLVARCRPPESGIAAPPSSFRTPWYRRGAIVAGTAGGTLLVVGGGVLLWLGDRAARAANDAADAGEPLADVVSHKTTSDDLRTAGGWLMGAGVVAVVVTQIVHRVSPRWQNAEVQVEAGPTQSSVALSVQF